MNILITKDVCIVDGGALKSVIRACSVIVEWSGDSDGREECIHLNNLCVSERGELEES